MADINKSRDQYVDAYAAVVQVTTVGLQLMPTQDPTKGLARAAFLVDSTGAPITDANPLPVDGSIVIAPVDSNTGTLSNVSGSITSGTILAANTARLGASVYNDSSAILYLRLSSGTASATSFTVKMQPEDYYEVPFSYVGAITGVWASATGAARVTEFT